MTNPKRSGVLTGTAGVYFVASRLAAKGFHAAPTFGIDVQPLLGAMA